MQNLFGPTRRGSAAYAALGAAVLLLLLTVPVILMPKSRTGESHWPGMFAVNQMGDQIRWHEPTVRDFAAQFPRFDLRDYRSATTPGYHIIMAAVAQLNDSRLMLQLVNALFGAAMAATVVFFAARLGAPLPAMLLGLPLIASSYVVGGSIWLSTDNLALMFAVLAVGLAVMMPMRPGRLYLSTLFATAAVMVRQIHLWAIAPALLAIITLIPTLPQRLRALLGARGRGDWPVVIALALAAMLPFLMLAWFVLMWGGLTPPLGRVVDLHGQGPNAAAIPFALAVIGFFGMAYVPLVWTREGLDRLTRRGLAAAMSAGALAAVIVPTAPDREAGRGSGLLWMAADLHPIFTVAERSLVLMAFAAIGGGVLWLLWRRAARQGHKRTATILLLTFFGWVIAQSMNSQAWQRYFEPPVLILLIWLTALGWPGNAEAESRRIDALSGRDTDLHPRPRSLTTLARWAPLAAIALLQILICTGRIYVPLARWNPE